MLDINLIRKSTLIDEECKIEIINKELIEGLELEVSMEDELNQRWECIIPFSASNKNLEVQIDDIIPQLRYKRVSNKNLIKKFYVTLFNNKTAKINNESKCNNKFIKFNSESQLIRFKIKKCNKKLLDKSFTLNILSEEIKSIYINNNFVGKYFYKDLETIRPAIIVIGGSSGGFAWSEQVAALLSSYGYNTLAVSYFDYKGKSGQKRSLTNIPLEYFNKSISWLKKRSEVDNKKLGLIGISKGAEAALLLGSRYKDSFKAIAAYCPPSYSFEGVYLGKQKDIASWSYRGKNIEYIRYPKEAKFSLFLKHAYLKELHVKGLLQSTENQKLKSIIDVQSIIAKTLLISGSLDNTWPSDIMCKEIVKNNPNKIEHINYEGAGHMFLLPNLPPILDSDKLSTLDSFFANIDAWNKLKDFFNLNL